MQQHGGQQQHLRCIKNVKELCVCDDILLVPQQVKV